MRALVFAGRIYGLRPALAAWSRTLNLWDLKSCRGSWAVQNKC